MVENRGNPSGSKSNLPTITKPNGVTKPNSKTNFKDNSDMKDTLKATAMTLKNMNIAMNKYTDFMYTIAQY